MGSRVRAFHRTTVQQREHQVCFFVGCYAPFPRSDPRSVLNPLIEPWWCRVPKIMREVHAPCRPAASTVNWNTLYPCSSSSGNLEHPVVPAFSQPACHSVLLLPHSSTACKMFLTNNENAKKFLNLIRFKLVMSVLSLIAIY